MSENKRNKSAQSIARARKIKMLGVYSIFIITLVLVAILACIFVFFKVDNINVSGLDMYSESEIIEGSGLETGENLVFVNTTSIEERLELQFTYIETVEVKKVIPNSIEITAEQAEIYYSFLYNNEYLYVSQNGKALDFGSEPYEDTLVVEGIDITIVDGRIQFAEIAKEIIFDEIASIYHKEDESKITKVDLENSYNVTVYYDDRIEIQLGEASDITYKLNFGMEIITNIGDNEYGTLDLSLSKDANKAYFMPTDAPLVEVEEFTNDELTDNLDEENDTSEDSTEGEEDTDSSDSDVGESDQSDQSGDDSSDEEVTEPSSQRGDDIPDF